MNEKLLKEVGLTGNEATVYLKLLEGGILTPVAIASQTKLSRENVYNVTRALLKKSLIELVPRRKKKTYRPLPPQNLASLVEKEMEDIKLRKGTVNSIIPSLENLYKLNLNKPGVSFFEGMDGIKKIYSDTIRGKNQETLVFRSVYDDIVLDDFLEKYLQKRASLGIKNRMITPDVRTRKDQKTNKLLARSTKVVPKNELNLPTEITVYGNKVSFVSLRKERLGFIIESQDLAESMTEIFNYIWNKK